VLEYLKDQKDNPDRELLDELGWTEAELAAFLTRWQQLKQAAAEDNTGKRELDESLRSLGLRPTRDRVRQGTTQSDGATGLRDSGPRTAPPRGYQELFDAFKKGAARSTR
jgi:collagen type III alpha